MTPFHSRRIVAAPLLHLLLFLTVAGLVSVRAAAPTDTLRPRFQWLSTGPLLSASADGPDHYWSIKDPSVVFDQGRWHVFATVRGRERSHQIEYLSFADWNSTSSAERHFLQVTNGYYCAPQVFYFTPHRKWYLIYQASDTNRPVALQPVFSTVDTLADWRGWTAPRFLYERHPANVKGWIDFWIICDEARAHLFFTSNNGLMWRAETRQADFPFGWSEPKVVLRDDIFEASHTYKLKGRDQYLTLVEAQAGSRRYYKAYLAPTLDGAWTPLAATAPQPFAALSNVRDSAGHWADSISHGELLRIGVDERLEVDPQNLRFLFQGVLDRGKKYGEIPWRLGILDRIEAGP